jgi:hypothetical protein
LWELSLADCGRASVPDRLRRLERAETMLFMVIERFRDDDMVPFVIIPVVPSSETRAVVEPYLGEPEPGT